MWINEGTEGVTSRGVSIDHLGNLWVADTFNNRVLRFPNGSKNADLVLGQSSLTASSCVRDGSMNKMCYPTLAKLHPFSGELFVLDEYGSPFRTRMLVFKPPFTNGMAAYKTIVPKQSGPFTGWGGPDGTGNYVFESTGFMFNTYKVGEYAPGEIWLNEHTANRTLLIDYDGNIIKIIGARNDTTRGGDQQFTGCSYNIDSGNYLWWPGGSIGIDIGNNIYLADEQLHTVFRYSLPYILTTNGSTLCLPEANGALFPKGPNTKTNDSLGESWGLGVFGNQLLVRDQDKTLKIWNDPQNKSLGSTADVVLQQSFASRSYLSTAVDDSNRLWVSNEHGLLKVYPLPLTSTGQPLKQDIPLYWQDDGNQINYKNFGGVAFDKLNKKLYVYDNSGTRILRISNYNDFNNKLFVDMVIGQKDKNTLYCNQSSQNIPPFPSPTAEGLCKVTQMVFDNYSNLYAVDNDYECHGNNRIVTFLASDLQNATGLFPNIQAKKVFNAPDLDSKGSCAYATVDKPGSPVSIAFNSKNNMVVGNDGYYGDSTKRELKQLWFYRDPVASQEPDASIDLYMGTPAEIAFDQFDNLFVQDGTWYRVSMVNLDQDTELLNYLPGKTPPSATSSPSPKATPRSSPTTSPSPSPSTLTITSGPTASVTAREIIFSWATNLPSSSKVDIGLVSGTFLHQTPLIPALTTTHTVTAALPPPCVTVYYQVVSQDTSGNNSVSKMQNFNTGGCIGSSNILAEVSYNVASNSGGVIDLLDAKLKGIELNIPSSYTGSNATFQMKKLDKATYIQNITPPSGQQPIGDHIYRLDALTGLTSTISSFNSPIKVTVKYDSADLTGINTSTLKINRYDGSSWQELSNCAVDTTKQEVTCETSRFSDFALMGEIKKTDVTQTASQPSKNNLALTIIFTLALILAILALTPHGRKAISKTHHRIHKH